MPATDGDNAWGGGFSSWLEATPKLFNDAGNAGYGITTVQDLVDRAASPQKDADGRLTSCATGLVGMLCVLGASAQATVEERVIAVR